MVTVTPDPMTPDRFALTATVTVYIDRLMKDSLLNEVDKAIREQAKKDLTLNPEVQAIVAKAATEMLLQMLQGETHDKPSNTQ